MLVRSLSIAVFTLLALGLAGCSSVNERLSAGMGDTIPHWAGGLPADAPPRPGTAEYDVWMKERQRLRQMPAADRPKDATEQPTGSTSAR
ncbi:hypothetical protein SE91_08740 [Bradyrhizobium sp. DOA1]|nr:hypothetical protein SE91_08740 [Bradyrhizobium sp. DOA1]